MKCILYPLECFKSFLFQPYSENEYPSINNLSITLHNKNPSISQSDTEDWEVTSP